MCKVSIIIACYNSELFIRCALDAALSQKYKNIEVIVIDGASTDGTLSILKSYGNAITMQSEIDTGIADAWNKGLRKATGEYIYFLNSDDFIMADFISEAMSEIKKEPKKYMWYGDTDLLDSTNNLLKKIKGNHEGGVRYKGFGFYFTSLITPKEFFDRTGLFNDKIKIAIDTEWLFRAEAKGFTFKKHMQVNSMRMIGVSAVYRVKAYKEYFDIMKSNGYSKLLCELFYIRIKLIEAVKRVL